MRRRHQRPRAGERNSGCKPSRSWASTRHSCTCRSAGGIVAVGCVGCAAPRNDALGAETRTGSGRPSSGQVARPPVVAGKQPAGDAIGRLLPVARSSNGAPHTLAEVRIGPDGGPALNRPGLCVYTTPNPGHVSLLRFCAGAAADAAGGLRVQPPLRTKSSGESTVEGGCRVSSQSCRRSLLGRTIASPRAFRLRLERMDLATTRRTCRVPYGPHDPLRLAV
jgi:hypothetical protein